jgi:hypothetical protein
MSEALYLLGFSPKLIYREPSKEPPQPLQDGGYDTEVVEYFDADTLALAELFGIERLEAGSVLAWFKRIDRSDFVGEAGERNLSDIDWLTPRVMAHEEAVGQLSLQSSFYPARFGSLFSSEPSLHSYAVTVAQGLNQFFNLIRGKQEWGLKLFGNYAKAAQIQAERSGLIQDGVPLKGASYLKFKQLQRDLSRADTGVFAQARNAAIDSIHEAFDNVKERSLTGAKKPEAHEELLSNIAVLERIENAGDVLAWVEKWNLNSLENSGIRIELSGPWPAYSFCNSFTLFDDPHSNQQTGDERDAA